VAGLELGCAILHYEKTMNHWPPGSAFILSSHPPWASLRGQGAPC